MAAPAAIQIERLNESDDLDIYVCYSDDNGTTWSNGVRVNDDHTKNSQFLPKISLDPTTGNIAVVWYDSRADLGIGGPGDTDGIPNDDAQFWGAFSTDGGRSAARPCASRRTAIAVSLLGGSTRQKTLPVFNRLALSTTALT